MKREIKNLKFELDQTNGIPSINELIAANEFTLRNSPHVLKAYYSIEEEPFAYLIDDIPMQKFHFDRWTSLKTKYKNVISDIEHSKLINIHCSCFKRAFWYFEQLEDFNHYKSGLIMSTNDIFNFVLNVSKGLDKKHIPGDIDFLAGYKDRPDNMYFVDLINQCGEHAKLAGAFYFAWYLIIRYHDHFESLFRNLIDVTSQLNENEKKLFSSKTDSIDTLKNTQNSQDLTMLKVALIESYDGRRIRNLIAGKKIAEKYGWVAESSGNKMYQKFLTVNTSEKRRSDQGTEAKTKNRYKAIKSIISLLSNDGAEIAEKELKMIKDLIDNKY